MRSVLGIAIVLAAGIGFAKDDKKPAKLEGTYIIVGLEFGGEKIPDELISKGKEEERTIKITADKFVASKGGKEDPASYKIDASKTPAHITLTSKKGDKDEVMHGIYKVDGDTLTICAVESGKEEDRPKDFKTEKGGKSMILVLKKKDK